MKRKALWCAWCGDDLKSDGVHFCNKRCEQAFWRDVYKTNEDPSTVAALLRARGETFSVTR